METYPMHVRRWTRAEYARLIELGVFQPGEPVELLGGELTVSEPRGSAHYTAIGLVEDALRAALGRGWLVRSQGPIALTDDSEPEPDVAVTRGTRRDFPDAARFGWRYTWTDVLSSGSLAAPIVAPGARIGVADLLP